MRIIRKRASVALQRFLSTEMIDVPAAIADDCQTALAQAEAAIRVSEDSIDFQSRAFNSAPSAIAFSPVVSEVSRGRAGDRLSGDTRRRLDTEQRTFERLEEDPPAPSRSKALSNEKGKCVKNASASVRYAAQLVTKEGQGKELAERESSPRQTKRLSLSLSPPLLHLYTRSMIDRIRVHIYTQQSVTDCR